MRAWWLYARFRLPWWLFWLTLPEPGDRRDASVLDWGYRRWVRRPAPAVVARPRWDRVAPEPQHLCQPQCLCAVNGRVVMPADR